MSEKVPPDASRERHTKNAKHFASVIPVNRDDLHNMENDMRLLASFPGFAASVRRVKQERQTPRPDKTSLLFILASRISPLWFGIHFSNILNPYF